MSGYSNFVIGMIGKFVYMYLCEFKANRIFLVQRDVVAAVVVSGTSF